MKLLVLILIGAVLGGPIGAVLLPSVVLLVLGAVYLFIEYCENEFQRRIK